MSAQSVERGDQSYIVADAAVPLGRYPHARRAGSLIFVSGTSSRRSDGSIEGVETAADGTTRLDVGVQTRAVLANVDSILDESGASIRDLVQVTTYLVDMADFAAYNDAYNDVMPDPGPTRTTVAVRELPHPHLLIEIQAVAEVSDTPGSR